MTCLRYAAAVLLAVLYVLPARPQAVLPERGRDGGLRENVYGLGLSAGAASGIGVSFRHHLPGYFSYQLIGGIIKVDNRTSYAVGGEFQYDFIRGSGVRFFAVFFGRERPAAPPGGDALLFLLTTALILSGKTRMLIPAIATL